MATRRTTKRADRSRTPAPAITTYTDLHTPEPEEPVRPSPFADSLDGEFDAPPEAREDELPLLVEDMPHAEVEELDEDAHAPDDALGLNLRQMGAIPLLTRDQELKLAKQLEMRRRRYRFAAMS